MRTRYRGQGVAERAGAPGGATGLIEGGAQGLIDRIITVERLLIGQAGFGKTLQGLISRTLPGADLIITGLSDRAGLASVKEKLEGHPHV